MAGFATFEQVEAIVLDWHGRPIQYARAGRHAGFPTERSRSSITRAWAQPSHHYLLRERLGPLSSEFVVFADLQRPKP